MLIEKIFERAHNENAKKFKGEIKMKKIIVFVLLFAMMLSLAACGGSSDKEIKQPSNNSIEDNVDSSESKQSEQSESSVTAKATINETVLVDEEGVKITAKSLETGGLFGDEIKLLIENDSGKDLTFQCRNASVNGYMVETMMSVDVANGKKANDSLTFMKADLNICEISTIADMEFSFHIFTSDDWETYLDTAQIQLKTSVADTYQYTFDDSGDLIYDDNGVKVVLKGMDSNISIMGPSLIVYIENNTDKNITVQSQDVSVNGFMINTIFSADVVAGKHAIDTITFMNSELEENDIESIETVEISLIGYDFASYNTLFESDKINLSF